MAIHLLDVGLAFSGLFILWILLRPKKAPLPPGPKGLPILGNIFDMPVDQEWLTFAKWGEEFGVYMTKYSNIELNACSN